MRSSTLRIPEAWRAATEAQAVAPTKRDATAALLFLTDFYLSITTLIIFLVMENA